MKREILLTLGILFYVNGFAHNIKIEEQKIREKDNKVFVTFTVVADKIKSNERLTLIPVLYSGDKSKSLEPITIAGRNRAITDQRQSVSAGIRTTENQRIPYSLTVPYESWMADISLRIDRKVESCCTEQTLTPQAVVKEKPIRYDVVLPKIEPIKAEISPIEQLDIELPFLAPIAEYAAFKDDADVMRAEGALIIRFQQGRNIIDPTYDNNAKSLAQIRNVLELIDGDANASVGRIVLAGSSSPEGTAKRNDMLAQKRVVALQNYLKVNTRVDISLIESITIGEDWVGLRGIVEQSDMQYKDEVLAIIANVPVMQGREKQLMDLKWGRPYNYMLEHFFPKLRSAGYIRVFYESKPSEEFLKTNRAVELYNNKEYSDALIMLEGVKATAATENIRGVCYMMLTQYDKAEAALSNAIRLGNAQAEESLRELKKLQAVER